jgi:hypothetical protein|tara:strand:- start:15989 stop:16240 length:252 start_codon:yes stop_codon:yes gene_type:complete
MSTFIVKGSVVNNPTQNNIGRAQFVRLVATGATQTITVTSEDSTVLGEVYLHTAGDTAIIEKAPGDKLTMANGHAAAVGSPRS